MLGMERGCPGSFEYLPHPKKKFLVRMGGGRRRGDGGLVAMMACFMGGKEGSELTVSVVMYIAV